MSADILAHLQAQHAFDPAPKHHDLGVYYVPFVELVDGAHEPSEALLSACARAQRCALLGDSGGGKSSVIASALGPDAPVVAPIPVPIAREPMEVVLEPWLLFVHIASVIVDYATDAMLLDERAGDARLADVTQQRTVGRPAHRRGRVALGWMGATISAELTRQRADRSIERSATQTLEVVQQMMRTIHAAGFAPVLVFDDTDRWFAGTAYRRAQELALAFFGVGLHELTAVDTGLAVAVHRKYLSNRALRDAIFTTLDTRIDVPRVRTAEAVAKVVHSRVRAHAPSDATPSLDEVITEVAVERLFEHFRRGIRGGLRGVLRTVHTALSAGCDIGANVITPELVDDAVAQWEA